MSKWLVTTCLALALIGCDKVLGPTGTFSGTVTRIQKCTAVWSATDIAPGTSSARLTVSLDGMAVPLTIEMADSQSLNTSGMIAGDGIRVELSTGHLVNLAKISSDEIVNANLLMEDR